MTTLGTFDLLLIVIVTASVTTLIVAALWWAYLRGLIRYLANIQQNLRETQASLTAHQESLDLIRNHQHILMAAVHDRHGHPSQPHEVIQIDPSLSLEERERLIRYLKSEGFIAEE